MRYQQFKTSLPLQDFFKRNAKNVKLTLTANHRQWNQQLSNERNIVEIKRTVRQLAFVQTYKHKGKIYQHLNINFQRQNNNFKGNRISLTAPAEFTTEYRPNLNICDNTSKYTRCKIEIIRFGRLFAGQEISKRKLKPQMIWSPCDTGVLVHRGQQGRWMKFTL